MTGFGAVLSVNAGRAAPLVAQGETLLSGFVKHPTSAAQQVEVGGLIADDHVDDAADPDRAVLFYQRRHYDFWTAELDRVLPPGMFGEQLTIEGPAEDEVLIGDRLQVGGVLLEVTQPRIPCRRMAARFELEDMPIRFMRSGRTGFFCRVVEPGLVQAGDRVRLVERSPDELTVAQLATVLHSDELAPEQLQMALACSALPSIVRGKLTRIADRMADQARGWSGDRSLVVGSRVPHGSDIVAFDLMDPQGQRLPDFTPGQFLTLALQVPGSERPVVRTYTIAGRTADKLGYRLGVKREPAPAGQQDLPVGLASGYLHDTAVVGTSVMARAPRGKFVLQPGTRPVVLLSAGVGITPMLAMLEDLASTNLHQNSRETWFIHVARSSRELAFDTEVRALVAGRPHLHHHLLFSRPGPGDVAGVDFHTEGRLSPQLLDDLLPSLDADSYLCGPGPFMTDLAAGLLERGVPEDQVHYEFFGAAVPLFNGGGNGGDGDDAGAEVLDDTGRPILVTFAQSGITVPWRERNFSLLNLAEQSGLRPDASCRTGLCNTCVTRIDDGEVDYVIEPMDGVTPGKVAVCCARPRTSVMLDL